MNNWLLTRLLVYHRISDPLESSRIVSVWYFHSLLFSPPSVDGFPSGVLCSSVLTDLVDGDNSSRSGSTAPHRVRRALFSRQKPQPGLWPTPNISVHNTLRLPHSKFCIQVLLFLLPSFMLNRATRYEVFFNQYCRAAEKVTCRNFRGDDSRHLSSARTLATTSFFALLYIYAVQQ